MTTIVYPSALANAFGSTSAGNAPNIDYLSDDIYVALLADTYTPSLAHDFYDDVVANEISGTGYTANGVLLASKTMTTTLANSWGTTWGSATAYTLNAIVRPSTGNGFLYQAVVAGTSAGSEPTWPTVLGTTVTDSGVTWLCAGRAITVFDSADPSWGSSATFTARYGVIYDRTPASNATRPLIGYLDLGSNRTVTNSTFTLQLTALGLFYTLS